jgi:hypothetical protein
MSMWLAVLGLGAFHGVNPGMGWLFAVALGLQEQRRWAVWRAMVPLGVGHALAVGAVVLVAAAAGTVVPRAILQLGVGVLLVSLGVYKLVRHRHPRYGGMRVGMMGLTVWSFLMATAHGAGIMVLPAVLETSNLAFAADHAHHGGASGLSAAGLLLATALHGVGYLVVTALVAWLVYEKVGVLILRRAWWNLDVVWAVALIVTGVVCFVI